MLGRNGRSASQIGPLIAEDDDTARLLLARALSAIEGPVYLDFADAKTEIRAWLMQCGFVAQRPLTRMLYRRSIGFDDTSRTFAVVGPEFGDEAKGPAAMQPVLFAFDSSPLSTASAD